MRIALEDDGCWRISPAEHPPLTANLLLRDKGGAVCLRYQGNHRYQAEGVCLEAHFRPGGGAVEVTLRLEAGAGRHIDFAGIDIGPLHLAQRHRFFGAVPGCLEKQGVVPALTARQDGRAAAMFGVLADPDGLSLLAGIGAVSGETSAFSLVADTLRAGFKPERRLTGNHEFKLYLGAETDPLKLLAGYGRRLAHCGRCGEHVPTGWNTWDFYGGAVRMEDVEGEITALNGLAFRDRLEYLVVDMGWEQMWGDWVPNRRFPAEPGRVAGRIRAAGWRPGIWVAPLQASMFTPLARHRPELFLRNGRGGLIVEEDAPYGPVLLLDFSLPEVRAMAGGWFAALRGAGFELFKIDYLYEKYLRRCRHNAAGLGLTAFARSVFQTIRDAVGGEAHIINCGAGKEAALGLVDSSRVTVDIHNFWGHIRNNARQLAHASWMNRRLWINDPDFAIARHRGNCTARHLNMPYTSRPLASPSRFWMRGPEASRDEMRLWLSVVRLNGGSLFLSDSIRALTAEGRSDLGRLFPPLEAPFVPLDLFERESPGIWLSQDTRRPTLGLFNWADKPQTLILPPPFTGGVSGREFWGGRAVRFTGALELPPRAGRLVEL